MEFLEVLHTYFRGERTEALFYILPSGLALIGLAATAFIGDRGGFGYGMGIPLVVGGLLLVGGGSYIGARTPAQVEQLEKAYADDPKAMVEDELPRMETVNANWPRLIGAWTVFVVAGVGIRYGFKAEWAHGVGPALIIIGAVGFLIDGFAERRARPYAEALEALAAEHGVGMSRPSETTSLSE